MAAHLLATRRGNPAPEPLQRQHDEAHRDLRAILQGRMKVPQAVESIETTPTVTNFDTDLRRRRAKVRRVGQTSTGQPPTGRSFPE